MLTPLSKCSSPFKNLSLFWMKFFNPLFQYIFKFLNPPLYKGGDDTMWAPSMTEGKCYFFGPCVENWRSYKLTAVYSFITLFVTGFSQKWYKDLSIFFADVAYQYIFFTSIVFIELRFELLKFSTKSASKYAWIILELCMFDCHYGEIGT